MGRIVCEVKQVQDETLRCVRAMVMTRDRADRKQEIGSTETETETETEVKVESGNLHAYRKEKGKERCLYLSHKIRTSENLKT